MKSVTDNDMKLGIQLHNRPLRVPNNFEVMTLIIKVIEVTQIKFHFSIPEIGDSEWVQWSMIS